MAVTGIGGFFFRSSDPQAPAAKGWMLNLRVDDLDGLTARLAAAGIEVITKPEWNASAEVGRFARIHDPEGNPIELWQPPAS
jgi:predicted enzyme related to lactoylglutathione lyase